MNFDWNKIFIGDMDFSFALEIVIRTLVMFSMVLLILRLSGKKGVRQLSLFEVAIIIGLGSAAGDPMFNEDAPILPALVVFATILLFYRGVTYLAMKSERFEKILEGDAMYVIEDGQFVLLDENEHTFAKDEFFSELRQQSIEHLGQVRIAVLETNGNVSFYYFGDDDVKFGLPVLPKVYATKSEHIEKNGKYACTYCGNVQTIKEGITACLRCRKKEWIEAINTIRLT